MQLPNHTVPIPGEEDFYIIGLDVFHQIHCLVRFNIRNIASSLTEIQCRTICENLSGRRDIEFWRGSRSSQQRLMKI
jgi:hypothetical protein